jgi:hypothetical protein
VEPAGLLFGGELTPNDDPQGLTAATPTFEDGGWVLRQAGTNDPLVDTVDFVRLDTSTIPLIYDKVLSVWVQSNSVGHVDGTAVQLFDGGGGALVGVAGSGVAAAGDPVETGMPLAAYTSLEERIQFQIEPPSPGNPVQWFLTVRIEDP